LKHQQAVTALLVLILFAGCLPGRMEEGHILFRNQSDKQIWVHSCDMGGGEFSCGLLSPSNSKGQGYRKGKLPETILIKLKWWDGQEQDGFDKPEIVQKQELEVSGDWPRVNEIEFVFTKEKAWQVKLH
jgi:hypothetical protein